VRAPQDVIDLALHYKRDEHIERFRHDVREHRGDVNVANALFHANLALEYETALDWWQRNRAKLGGEK
jgi:hypothetical protein